MKNFRVRYYTDLAPLFLALGSGFTTELRPMARINRLRPKVKILSFQVRY
jgi:hypothetical protein